MTEQLNNLLLEHLGELLYKQEHTFDWIEQERITRKINAIHTLLDANIEETFFEKLYKLVTKL